MTRLFFARPFSSEKDCAIVQLSAGRLGALSPQYEEGANLLPLFINLAGEEGFEPSYAGIKIRCLNRLATPLNLFYCTLSFHPMVQRVSI